MPRLNSHINTAISIIESYKGELPFAIFIRKFFAAEKKYGSTDRRQIASLCYNYFRIGHGAKKMPVKDKLALSCFLCTETESDMMERLNPEWNQQINLPLSEKIKLVKKIFSPAAIFPFTNQLNNDIDAPVFSQSFLTQPDLFFRIRPSFSTAVVNKLNKAKIPYQLLGETSVQTTSATKLEDILTADKEIVIQDFNSQQVLNYLKESAAFLPTKNSNKIKPDVWDCCAASGGKSILIHDMLHGKLNLTISDIRPSIIFNLHQRFKKAGIKEYQYFIADISKNESINTTGSYDIIICDAPCSGSGTWGRTPEQLLFFQQNSIDTYSALQKKIAGNAIKHLKKGGLFFYITCSVFTKENEAVVDFIQEEYPLSLLNQQALKGYDKKADSMFVAVFQHTV